MPRSNGLSKIFFRLPLLFLLVYCIDIFFAVPNADDFDFFLWIKKYGFFGFQKYMYLHQNGRFVASFFLACYSALFNVIHVYWIFPFCSFILFYLSFFLFLRAFFNYLGRAISFYENVNCAAWLSLFFILMCRQLSSFLFWMPGIINYQLVITFFILGAAWLFKYYIMKSNSTLLLTLLCFALASGLHELFFLLIMPALLFCLVINFKNSSRRNTVLLIIMAVLIPFVISYFSPGTGLRQALSRTASPGIFAIILNTFLHVALVLGSLVTVPYLYISLIIVYVFFSGINSPRLFLFFEKIKIIHLIAGLVLQPMLIFLIAITNISSGLPERAENLLLIQASVFLLLIAMKLGIEKNMQPPGNSFLFASVFSLLLFFLCLASPNMINGCKGLISGYIYKEISKSRIANLKINKGTKTLYLTNYRTELDSFYAGNYNRQIPVKLMKIAQQNKIILFADVYDLLEGQVHSFSNYNDIDTIKTPLWLSFGDTLIHLPVIKNAAQ